MTKGIDAWRKWTEGRYQKFPLEHEELTISINAGRKIVIWFDEKTDTVYRVWARTGRETWQTCDSWLEKDGNLRRPLDGPEKLRNAIWFLADNINQKGLSKALETYGRQSICCLCGAALKDPESIQRAIGPECIKKVEAARIMRLLFGE